MIIPEKKKATSQIITIYRSNREKLECEMSKSVQDKVVSNNIQAYRHILTHLERVYDIPNVMRNDGF